MDPAVERGCASYKKGNPQDLPILAKEEIVIVPLPQTRALPPHPHPCLASWEEGRMHSQDNAAVVGSSTGIDTCRVAAGAGLTKTRGPWPYRLAWSASLWRRFFMSKHAQCSDEPGLLTGTWACLSPRHAEQTCCSPCSSGNYWSGNYRSQAKKKKKQLKNPAPGKLSSN